MTDEKKQVTLGDILRATGWERTKSSHEKALDSIHPANYLESETLTLTPNGVQFLYYLLEKEEIEAEAWDMSLIKSLKDKLNQLKKPE